MQSKFTECGFKKSRFVKEQEAKALLNKLVIKHRKVNSTVKFLVLRCIK